VAIVSGEPDLGLRTKEAPMPPRLTPIALAAAAAAALLRAAVVMAQERTTAAKPSPVPRRGETSYAPVAAPMSFNDVYTRMSAAKPQLTQQHRALLESRYDLANRPGKGRMTKGKAVQAEVRIRLPAGVTW